MPMIRDCIVDHAQAKGQGPYRAARPDREEEAGSRAVPALTTLTFERHAVRGRRISPTTFSSSAGCLVGRRDGPNTPLHPCFRRRARRRADPCRARGGPYPAGRAEAALPLPHRADASHAPFKGSKPRASRGDRGPQSWRAGSTCFPARKSSASLGYLQIAVEKTAGPREHEAGALLVEKIETTTTNAW